MLKSVAMQFKKRKSFLKKIFLGGVLNTKILEKDPTNFTYVTQTRGKTNFFGETINFWNYPFTSFVSA